MRPITTLALVTTLFTSAPTFGQFLVREDYFTPTGLTNDGLIAGYLDQGGSFMIWDPDNSTTEDIGGLAPGNGVGGQAYFSNDGQRLAGTSAGPEGAELSSYDRGTGEWTAHGGLGSVIDGTVGGGWSISGDGGTVVGLSWGDTTENIPVHAHAVAYNAEEGIMDLGTLYAGRSTRANAVSGDGSVVVGWQDFNGPWKAAVWRKNPGGSYFPNNYILIDPNGDPNDEFNQLGECSAISYDGTWIGGYGDYANDDEPWIWSESTGVVNLGSLPLTGRGFVSGMSSDGSIVVGWFDGELFGDPRTPFIWTAEDGLQDVNTFVPDPAGHHIYTVNTISPDGRYITGYGVGEDGFSPFAYRLDLDFVGGLDERNGTQGINAYPNPVLDAINFMCPTSAELTICSMDGAEVYRSRVNGNVSLDLSYLATGVYSMVLRSEGALRTQKIIKR